MRQWKTTMESFYENNPWICKFPLPQFSKRERKDAKGGSWSWRMTTAGQCSHMWRAEPSCAEVFFVCCRTSSPLGTGDAAHAREWWKLLLLLCLWYTSTDFSFSVVVYTDTQRAQFLKLSSSKGNANINFVEAPPPTHPGMRFFW